MDALSHLIMLNAPQGSIDKNCLLNGDWHLPHAAGELSVVRWHTVTQGQHGSICPPATPWRCTRQR
ncbi:Uncharacterised protein [Yokenella regensburgei]|nr:Uncharacterised protein [Yokenella regensburgei]